MGKKSRSPSSSHAPVPAPARTRPPAQETPPPSPKDQEAGWRRIRRSLIILLAIAALSLVDLLTLQDVFTVAIPDNKPLLALVTLFGWVVWKRWSGGDKQGMHPIGRTVGFVIALVGFLAVLPFNSTVSMLEVPLLTVDECKLVSEAAAEMIAGPGFMPAFTVYDHSTEVPLKDLPDEVFALVMQALDEKLMPFVAVEYGKNGEIIALDDRLYVEHYHAHHEPPPAAHLRPGQLSLRVELTPPESKYVGGGGVVLGSMGKSITPGTGNGLILPAKLKHGSTQPGPDSRSVLVGTLTVRGKDPWQRFVSIWRLWGLFARSVRYSADKRLPTSAWDTIIPSPDDPIPEAIDEAGIEVGLGDGEAGSGTRGGAGGKLEF